MSNPRDHGLGESGTPLSAPTAKPVSDSSMECPNCGCEQVMSIDVRVADHLLKGGVGQMCYLGCPACPWASPAVSFAVSPENPTDG